LEKKKSLKDSLMVEEHTNKAPLLFPWAGSNLRKYLIAELKRDILKEVFQGDK
jgi:hypothetical protein